MEIKHILRSKKGCLYLAIFEAHEVFSCLAFDACRQVLWGVSASFYQSMMQSGNKVAQPWHHRARSLAGRGRKPRFYSQEENPLFQIMTFILVIEILQLYLDKSFNHPGVNNCF